MKSTLKNLQIIGLRSVIIALVMVALPACGEKPQQPAPLAEPAKRSPAPAKLFQDERTTLDKAKMVDDTVDKSSEALRQEVEQQTK